MIMWSSYSILWVGESEKSHVETQTHIIAVMELVSGDVGTHGEWIRKLNLVQPIFRQIVIGFLTAFVLSKDTVACSKLATFTEICHLIVSGSN